MHRAAERNRVVLQQLFAPTGSPLSSSQSCVEVSHCTNYPAQLRRAPPHMHVFDLLLPALPDPRHLNCLVNVARGLIIPADNLRQVSPAMPGPAEHGQQFIHARRRQRTSDAQRLVPGIGGRRDVAGTRFIIGKRNIPGALKPLNQINLCP